MSYSKEEQQTIKRAESLTTPGGHIPPGEDVQTVLAAARLLGRNGAALSPDHQRIVTAASNIDPNYNKPPRRAKPTPFDEEANRREARVAECKAAKEAADDALYESARDVETLTGAGAVMLMGGKVTLFLNRPRAVPRPNAQHVREAEAAAEEAARKALAAGEALQHALAQLAIINSIRSTWRADNSGD